MHTAVLGFMLFVKIFTAAVADFVTTHQTLVVLEDESLHRTHSQFFEQLQKREHHLTFASTSDNNITLRRHGEYLYDNLVLLAPRADAFGAFDLDDIINFVDEGHNIFVAGAPGVSDMIRNLAGECGVEYDAEATRVIDHFCFADTETAQQVQTQHGSNTLVYSSSTVPLPVIVGHTDQSVLFSGIGMAVDDENILTIKTLTGSDTAYSANPREAVGAYPQSVGKDTVLVASVQMRNNARATFTGSLVMLSNLFFKVHSHGNRDFFKNVTAWTFGEQGVLSAANVRHSKTDGSPPPSQRQSTPRHDLPPTLFPHPEMATRNHIYRVRDRLRYSVTVKELTVQGWVPFQADDMQLEAVMLDPYVRVTLRPDVHGVFAADFKAPDVHGVYQLRVLYRRLGFSTITLSSQISVRPLRHNEFERFITVAYPYYTSAVGMMVGVFVFSFYFLFITVKTRKHTE